MESTASDHNENYPTKLFIPLNGILKEEDGGYAAMMNGVKVPVAYVSDVRCWFLLKPGTANHFNVVAPIFLSENGEWLIAKSPEEARCQTAPGGTYEESLLPDIPIIPEGLKAIPGTVHIIWIDVRPLPG